MTSSRSGLSQSDRAYAQVHTPLTHNLTFADALVQLNAGGHVRKALPDLLALDSVINFDNLFIIHHTDCGMTHKQDEKTRELLLTRAPELERDIQTMQFGWIDE